MNAYLLNFFTVSMFSMSHVEFFNKLYTDPNETNTVSENIQEQFPDGMFRFQNIIE